MFLIFILYLGYALSFIIGSISIKYVDPIALVSLRMVLSGLIMSAYAYIKKYKFPDLKSIIILSLVHIALPFSLEFEAYKYTTACSVAFIFNLTPFITGFVEQIFYKKFFTLKQWAALVGAFLATTIATLDAKCINFKDLFNIDSFHVSNTVPTVSFLGDLMIFGAVTLFAIGWVYIKSLEEKKYSIVSINGTSMLLGGLATSLFSVLRTPGALIGSINPTGIFFAALLIFIGNIVSWNLYGYLLKKYSATFLALAGSITPIIITIIEWIIYNKVPSITLVLSTILIMISIKFFLMNRD